LDSLSFGTGPVEVLLLGDGPDAEMVAALRDNRRFAALAQSLTTDPKGEAACFNRLVSWPADVVVLIESGTVLGPGCLDLLVDALRVPGRGLAGPSTNRSWNEQGAFPRAIGTEESIRRTAAEAKRRFGSAARSLEPLHSLADFCFAVTRQVIDVLGAADEAYGLGPCFEMDYSVRAARAGFRGVWVGAAYAYRYPATARRQREEAARMTASRHLYQDRFCGLRLRAETEAYEPHCLGEECEHFAPSGLVSVHLPLQHPVSVPLQDHAVATRTEARTRRATVRLPPPRIPLVSCIMPTRDRAEFALRAVEYFLTQTHPRRELIVLEDGEPRLRESLPADTRVRYVATGAPARSIGAMRNELCALARGEIVAHFDDDDWHGPDRLSRQVAPIASGEADITALRDAVVFDLEGWRFWRCDDNLHRRLFRRDVHGGTLVYRRRVWEEKAQFPARSLAEDAAFLEQAVRRGALLATVPADGLYVYVRHRTNAWALRPGETGGPAGWRVVAEPALPSADRVFYAAHSAASPVGTGPPLVSCIMPTFDRRRFVSQAIAYFLRQDYPATELVVVDDGADSVADLMPDDPRVVYRRLDRRMVLGAKRNLACQLARGSVIAHFDDDDWSAQTRLTSQLAALDVSGADLCGSSSLLYYDPGAERAWRFSWPSRLRSWAAGPTLCYRRTLWERSPFPDIAIGEDTRFAWSNAVQTVADVGGTDCVVGVIHAGNTAEKTVHGQHWSPQPLSAVEAVLGDDISFYRPGRADRASQPHPMEICNGDVHNGRCKTMEASTIAPTANSAPGKS
jgi:glycosyltransferase involved in cell wall biosynthesis